MSRRTDEIGFGGLKLIQNTDGFCYGIDAVLLASFAAHRASDMSSVIDLGTGNGIIPLLLSALTCSTNICGVEMQEDPFTLAKESVDLNDLNDRIQLIHSDICNLPPEMDGSFTAVTMNPPYVAKGRGLVNRHDGKSMARHETTADLYGFFYTGARLLKDKGELFLVHRPSRLGDIIEYSRKAGLEPKTLRTVCPAPDEAPNLVLVHFVKNGGKELRMENNLYVRDKQGRWTDEIMEIYGEKSH